ncbi:PRC-barrel domain-containing protein [Alphaproteobacteria bacterium KMM 3653]|uniref:PRC-barrel domain-containing protein n=1 Tax=Harenicola maris TaxID=2841044 RepID=A0AAP2G913_9RHOB|nr:PRC-barrel domain-containing protein [Harenicola maris]
MKRFFTASAIALTLGTTAMAEGHSAVFSDQPFDAEVNVTASDLINARVYATEADLTDMPMATSEDAKNWQDIGEINDIILTRDGNVQFVIVGVGGFLGIGEKDVAVTMSDLKFISDGEEADEYFIVVNADRQGIQEAAGYDRGEMSDEESIAMGTPTGSIEGGSVMPPEIEREGYSAMVADDLTAEELTGTRVYGAGDEDIGEISEILLTSEGRIDRAVVDVGGFLGMGEHPVAMGMDEITIVRSADGSDTRVYISSSKEALEAMPAYKK